MRKYKRECKRNEQDFVYTAKRNPTWFCHKTKGHHVFELDFPNYCRDYFCHAYGIKAETPEEWYSEYRQKVYNKQHDDIDRILGGLILHYRCVYCNKKVWDTDENPDKRIREHINKKIWSKS